MSLNPSLRPRLRAMQHGGNPWILPEQRVMARRVARLLAMTDLPGVSLSSYRHGRVSGTRSERSISYRQKGAGATGSGKKKRRSGCRAGRPDWTGWFDGQMACDARWFFTSPRWMRTYSSSWRLAASKASRKAT